MKVKVKPLKTFSLVIKNSDWVILLLPRQQTEIAQQQKKTGKWIRTFVGSIECLHVWRSMLSSLTFVPCLAPFVCILVNLLRSLNKTIDRRESRVLWGKRGR